MWSAIRHTFKEWDAAIGSRYPLLWETRLAVVLPLILFAFLLLTGLALGLRLTWENFFVFPTPQWLLLRLGAVAVIFFLIWMYVQSRHQIWLLNGPPRIKRYMLKKNSAVAVVFIAMAITAYYPTLVLSKRLVRLEFEEMPDVFREPGETFSSDLVNQLRMLPSIDHQIYLEDSLVNYLALLRFDYRESYIIPQSRLDHLREMIFYYRINGYSAERRMIDSLSYTRQFGQTRISNDENWDLYFFAQQLQKRTNLLRQAQQYYYFWNYPAYLSYSARGVRRYLLDRPFEFDYRSFDHDNYTSDTFLWIIFALFAFPFVVHIITLFYTFLGFGELIKGFVVSGVVIFLFFFSSFIYRYMDLPQDALGESKSYLFKSGVAYLWRSILLITLYLSLILAVRRQKTGQTFYIQLFIAALPIILIATDFLTVAISNLTYHFFEIGLEAKFFDPFFVLAIALIFYFGIGTGYLRRLYRLSLLPR